MEMRLRGRGGGATGHSGKSNVELIQKGLEIVTQL